MNFMCEVCEDTFDGQFFLNAHMKNHFEICIICDEIFKTLRELEAHKATAHEKLDFKEEIFHKDNRELEQDQTDENIDTKIQCELCNEEFEFENDLLSHFESVHESNIEEESEVQTDHEKHKECMPRKSSTNLKGSRRKCNQCGKTFSQKNLKRHIETIHENKSGKELKKCDFCNESFRFGVGLKLHIKTVHSKKKTDCDDCGKIFKKRGELRLHIRTAHSKKKTNCDECSQRFKTRQDLETHMNSVHNGWKCDQCNKRFGRHYRLKQHHSFEHEGLSKPKCNQCDITFSNNDSLAVHIKSVHENGKVLFKRQCEECDEKI